MWKEAAEVQEEGEGEGSAGEGRWRDREGGEGAHCPARSAWVGKCNPGEESVGGGVSKCEWLVRRGTRRMGGWGGKGGRQVKGPGKDGEGRGRGACSGGKPGEENEGW